MKIRIYLQSISDIITNSSSELFAVIQSKDNLEGIYNILDRLFGWNQEPEVTMCIDKLDRPTQEMLDDDFHCWLGEYCKKPEDYPEKWIEIEIPYSLSDYKTFYKSGIEALLKEKFGDAFEIKYQE